jgi:hypothetical protein
MKMKDAQDLITKVPSVKSEGFRVHFTQIVGGQQVADYFPAIGEDLIATERDAWVLAHSFAAVTYGNYINIHVLDQSSRPVANAKVRSIRNSPLED